MDLQGRAALVTGAGHRIGRAIAVALGSRGMRVAVHYNASAAEAQQTVRMIEAAGGEASLLPGDLTVPGEPARIVAAAAERWGTLDVLVNSAAIMERTPIGQVTEQAWDAMFALNLRAPFFASQAAAEVMGERGGAIVNLADLAAFETWPAYVPHGISKAGVVQMTRGLARALAPRVRVNAVAPGVVMLPETWDPADGERLRRTTPLARNGSPDDVVRAVLYLLEAGFVTGETLLVDGGRHVRQ